MKRIFFIAICVFTFGSFSQAIAVGCNDQSVGDLSDPGYPVEPTQFDMEHDDPNFLKYDNVNFDVFQRQMHNRLVTVAIHKDHELSYEGRLEFSEFVFNTWAIFWKEFGGFPFPSYTILIGHDLPYGEVSAYGEGNTSPHTRTDLTAHEIYHAWNGCAFSQDNMRMWLMEGVTMYMGSVRQQSEYTYESIIKSIYDSPYGSYLNYYNSGQDRAIGDMGYYQDGYDHDFVAMKGMLVAYLLDKKLSITGHHG